jgi:hypothetical protein
MNQTGNPPVKLSALPDTHAVVICDHVFHGRRSVCDVYYYIGGEISMSCAQPDCDSADPADWHRVAMSAMRELDETLGGCPEIPQGYGFSRVASGLPWTLCPYETDEVAH